MNIKVNQKMVKERCGIVSFKKGEAFYRASKVEFEKYSGDRCEAIVTGAEDFSVMVEKDLFGDFHTTCSCPTLASFQKDCQHVAAVLLAICEHQRQGTTPAGSNEHQTDLFTNKKLTEGLLTLFGNQPTRPSGHQLHFEKRQVLDAEFTCRLAAIGEGQQMFGIEVKVGSTYVQNIREFLEQVKGGRSCPLSSTFTYDSNLHCFQKETDAVIQQLIQVIHDEKMYRGEQLEHSRDNTRNQMLLIPASSWERLMPLLMEVPMLLTYEGSTFEGFCLSEGLLPLQFDVAETEGEDYQLKIRGLENLIVLDSYSSVLFDGTLVRLKKEDCQRLSNLKKMLEASGMDQVLVPPKQLDSFFKNVMPGLKRLGHVQLSSAVSKLFMKTPLTAKVYLDRVKNRLLAGLEFHYGNIVIDPLDSRESQKGLMVIRDIEKENAIIKLFDESLFTRTDGGYFLQNEELEYQFLYHVVPKLQKLVQLYATTAVRNRIFRGNSRPQIRVKAGKERTNWLEFKFELDGIPEKQICEILLALEEKRKYYRLPNGSLFSLETRELEEIHHFLNMLPNQPEDLHSGLHVPIVQGLPLLDSVDNSKLFLFEESFRQFLEVLHNPGSLEFEVPKSLEPILRDYQRQGYKWMKTLANYGFGGILADDMGMGKTLQSITFIVSVLPDIRKRKLPVLIVCPSSLTYNWLSELAKFAPHLQAVIMDGNQTERLKKQKDVTAMDVIIISYPLLRREIKWFEKQTFHTVFFDEAQAFKNSVTQTARAVKKIMADHRFALTGTPVENSSEELWSIFHVVFPQLFPSLREYSNLPRKTIARRIRPFLLRRLKEDLLSELPDKIESTETVELLPDQKRLYAAYLAKLREDTLKHLDKDTIRKKRIKILAGLTRLRQLCCHPALFVDGYKGSSAKFEQLLQIIEEAKLAGRRVLIFSQFTKMLELIGRELADQGLSFFYLDGQTPSEERVALCTQFNAGERHFFLISLKAGGTGLNLTGADTVILYDLWWNPAVEEQAADRAYRIGQKNEVEVIKLVARGTIEEKMNELQDKKRDLIEEILQSEKKTTFTLTEEDIREILMI